MDMNTPTPRTNTTLTAAHAGLFQHIFRGCAACNIMCMTSRGAGHLRYKHGEFTCANGHSYLLIATSSSYQPEHARVHLTAEERYKLLCIYHRVHHVDNCLYQTSFSFSYFSLLLIQVTFKLRSGVWPVAAQNAIAEPVMGTTHDVPNLPAPPLDEEAQPATESTLR